MKKTLVLAAAALMAATAPAFADDHMEAATEVEAAADAVVETQELTLQDGTKVHVKGEEVFVVGEDGTETPAPDGVHTLEDGTTVTTSGGKLVTEEAPAEEAAH